MGKWVLYIIVIILSYLIGGTLVQYSINHDFSSVFIKPTAADEKYSSIDLGWIKVYSPCPLNENLKQASKQQKIASDNKNWKGVQNVTYYDGVYKPSQLAIDVYFLTSGISPNPKEILARHLAVFGKEAMEKALLNSKKSQENGSTKYIYRTELQLNNTSIVVGYIACVKDNHLIVLSSGGESTPENKNIVQHILEKTECFPEKK